MWLVYETPEERDIRELCVPLFFSRLYKPPRCVSFFNVEMMKKCCQWWRRLFFTHSHPHNTSEGKKMCFKRKFFRLTTKRDITRRFLRVDRNIQGNAHSVAAPLTLVAYFFSFLLFCCRNWSRAPFPFFGPSKSSIFSYFFFLSFERSGVNRGHQRCSSLPISKKTNSKKGKRNVSLLSDSRVVTSTLIRFSRGDELCHPIKEPKFLIRCWMRSSWTFHTCPVVVSFFIILQRRWKQKNN